MSAMPILSGPEIFDYASQPKERVTACNLCGSSVFVTVAHRDRYGFPVTVDACRACGLVFLNPRMTREGYAKFYDGPYRELVSAYHGRDINAQTIQPEQRRYAEALARWIKPHMSVTGGQMLDIGGSTGVVAKALSDALGVFPTIVDPARQELERAPLLADGRPMLRYCMPAEEFECSKGQFNLVTICQTIDHCADIQRVMTIAHVALGGASNDDRPTGLLFVDIVDFRAVMAAKGVNGAIKLDHPYYLTDETIRGYFYRCGFEVVAMNYAPDGIHIGYLCKPLGLGLDHIPPMCNGQGALREIREARQ